MMKKYNSPEVKFIKFQQTDDVIQTSGLEGSVPKYTLAGVSETLADYGTNNFSIFNQ